LTKASIDDTIWLDVGSSKGNDILAMAICIGSLLIGGIYEVSSAGQEHGFGTFIVNKFTGHARLCGVFPRGFSCIYPK
jgi:hypothetical protein